MIDSHCHLTDPRLGQQLDTILERAATAGVARMITIGTEIDDALKCIELCRALDNVRCAIGIHPNYCHEVSEEDLPRLEHLQADPTVVALGEMGLDYFHHFAPRERQHEFFQFQLNLAARLKRPIIIHCREAIDDAISILRGFPSLEGVFHCFTGSPDEAKKILNAGYHIGFTGAVTFKKNDDLRKACSLVPLDRLLVETDAPYLSPEPVRAQKTNEPSFVMHVARVVSQVKGISLEELDHRTTINVQRLFRWP
jgi:TatD DNase family protein